MVRCGLTTAQFTYSSVHIAAALERSEVGFHHTGSVEWRHTQSCFKVVLLLLVVTGPMSVARWYTLIGTRPGSFGSWQNPRGQDTREDSVEMDLPV